MDKKELTQYIKSEAKRLGFDICGITEAKVVDDNIQKEYCRWINAANHGAMHYLERNSDKRFDPGLLVEGCRSIIVVAMNYYPQQRITGISDYAIGKDYHKVVKERLFQLLKSINEKTRVKGRAFCDSAPVLERYWAVQAGLGWIGKNRQLIIPGKGSCFFLGELIVDIELDYDRAFESNHCGDCYKCIEACPGRALTDRGFDARKCLSYLTIEYRGELLPETGALLGDCFYGCDRCSAVCPHNRFSTPNITEEFQPREDLLKMGVNDWENLTKEEYDKLFADSAVERCGYEQLMRNIKGLRK